MCADRVEGEQQRQEDLDWDALRMAHEERDEDERAGRGQQRRRRQASPYSEWQRHEQEQHREDATAADDVHGRGRMPPEVELRPDREGERDRAVAPAVDHCAHTHVWNVLRLVAVRINSAPDPGHPAGLRGNSPAGRR